MKISALEEEVEERGEEIKAIQVKLQEKGREIEELNQKIQSQEDELKHEAANFSQEIQGLKNLSNLFHQLYSAQESKQSQEACTKLFEQKAFNYKQYIEQLKSKKYSLVKVSLQNLKKHLYMWF